MKLAAFLFVLLLVGCATPKPLEVLIPVHVPCEQSIPEAPVYSYAPGTYTKLFNLVRDLRSDRELALGHITQLEAALKACK